LNFISMLRTAKVKGIHHQPCRSIFPLVTAASYYGSPKLRTPKHPSAPAPLDREISHGRISTEPRLSTLAGYGALPRGRVPDLEAGLYGVRRLEAEVSTPCQVPFSALIRSPVLFRKSLFTLDTSVCNLKIWGCGEVEMGSGVSQADATIWRWIRISTPSMVGRR